MWTSTIVKTFANIFSVANVTVSHVFIHMIWRGFLSPPFFHRVRTGNKCLYSHAPLTPEQRAWLRIDFELAGVKAKVPEGLQLDAPPPTKVLSLFSTDASAAEAQEAELEDISTRRPQARYPGL